MKLRKKMVEVVLGQASMVTKVAVAIKGVVRSGAIFLFTGGGLSLNAMDPSESAMIEMLIPSYAFAYYRCYNTFFMGLKLDQILHLFHQADDDDIISLTAQEGDPYVTFTFQSPMQDKESCDHQMNLTMVIDKEFLFDIYEEAEYDAIVELPSSHFRTICFHIATLSDIFNIYLNHGDSLTLTTAADFGVSETLCIHVPHETHVIRMSQPVSVAFEMRYVDMVLKAMPLSDTLTISLSRVLPAVFEYKIAADQGFVRFYVPICFPTKDT